MKTRHFRITTYEKTGVGVVAFAETPSTKGHRLLPLPVPPTSAVRQLTVIQINSTTYAVQPSSSSGGKHAPQRSPLLMSEQNIALPGIQPSVVADPIAVPKDQSSPSTAARNALTASSLTWLELIKWAVSFPAMLGMLLVGRIFYEAKGFNIDPDMWW